VQEPATGVVIVHSILGLMGAESKRAVEERSVTWCECKVPSSLLTRMIPLVPNHAGERSPRKMQVERTVDSTGESCKLEHDAMR
jgi:hypothetical protein